MPPGLPARGEDGARPSRGCQGKSYFEGKVEENEVRSFLLFEDLEIVVQSAVLVDSGKQGAWAQTLGPAREPRHGSVPQAAARPHSLEEFHVPVVQTVIHEFDCIVSWEEGRPRRHQEGWTQPLPGRQKGGPRLQVHPRRTRT